MIGSALVRHLLSKYHNAHLVLPVRNREKAEMMFKDCPNIAIYECDLLHTNFDFAQNIDYIIHCAAPTSSRYFVEHPIETYKAVYQPSVHLLQYATRNKIKGFVYLSSLEVYGDQTDNGVPLVENALGNIDLTSPRSCYPLAKRAVEHLCVLYALQHNVPVSTARLTQTTGAGGSIEDNRVINAFCRSAAKGEDIILHTIGESARPYCHIDDAISAILLLLQKGKRGEAYNVANESTYISAHDLAFFIKEHLAPAIEVKTVLKNENPYAPPSQLRLSTTKLQSLGWHPRCDLEYICRDVYQHYKLE